MCPVLAPLRMTAITASSGLLAVGNTGCADAPGAPCRVLNGSTPTIPAYPRRSPNSSRTQGPGMTAPVDTNAPGDEPVARRTVVALTAIAAASLEARPQRPESTRSDRAGRSSPQQGEVSPHAARLPAARAATRDLTASSGSRNRRLHAGHFAFMRAVVQGVDVSAAWDRYLLIEGESSDARAMRSTMAWIRDEFAAAQRHARYGVARLVRLDSARLAGAQARVPALEDFALERGLEDFSQAEQLEAFEAEYRDILRRTRRRERLIDRQLEALGWLESLAEQPHRARRAIAQPPRASDSVDAWLNPLLVRHLRGAGLASLGQLVERINGIGLRWYAPIRGLGPVKAERILSGCAFTRQALGPAAVRHWACTSTALDRGFPARSSLACSHRRPTSGRWRN
jgi:hypothetical protein